MINLSNCRVLIVDDTETNIDLLVDALGENYRIGVALNGKEALEDVAHNPPDLILLDIMMPVIDGYETCRRLKSNAATRDIPVIFLTAMSEEQDEEQGLELGAVDYIRKPFNLGLVQARVRNQLELKQHRNHLEELVRIRTRELELTQEATIESMATLAEYRDPETGGHIKRTQNYVKLLACHLGQHGNIKIFQDESTVNLLYKSATLHDIGKVGVPDNILLKPGKLTEEEFEEMKKHTLYGRDTILTAGRKLGEESFLQLAKEIAESHHEKWNGMGYPYQLNGSQIPISGRIMALADVYDALISKRVYKPPFPHEKAVEIIKEERENHFDPVVVDAFLDISDRFREIALEFADFDEERANLRKPA